MTIANQDHFIVLCQRSIAVTRSRNQALESEATSHDFLSCQIV